MKRFVLRAPGAGRVPIFRNRSGLIVPRGMISLDKASSPERAANRRARERLAAEFERDLADVLVSFREAITIEAAEAAVAAGEARVIVNPGIPNELEAQLAAVVGENLEEALREGAGIGLRFAPPNLRGVPISIATEAAVATIERQAADLAVGLTDGTRRGIRAVLSLGVTDQIPPVEVARRIGDLAGLLPRQVRAVENFRAATTRRLAPVEEALTPQVQRVIDQEVARYRDRQLLFRGRTIAEAETQAAITAGEHAFWDRAVADGVVRAEDVYKTWRTVLYGNVCPVCEAVRGQTIRYGELFVTARGAKNGPPAHPRCRCYLEYAELGQPSTRPDQGPGIVKDQENRRYLDPAALQEDFAVARERTIRAQTRLSRLAPGSRAAARAERLLESALATENSLRNRLLETARTGYVRDLAGFRRPPVGSRVRNLRARKIPKGEIVEVVDYQGNLFSGAYDTAIVRRPDGTIARISEHSVELVDLPPGFEPPGGRE